MDAPHPAALPLPVPRSTARLVLRHFASEDAAQVAAMHGDVRLREHLVDDHALDAVDQAGLFIRRLRSFYWQRPGLGIWHASRRQLEGGSVFVGWFSLMPVAASPGEAELGSRLVPDAWGTGLALEGGELLLLHAFDTLRLSRVWGACAPGNRGARLCLAALGFGELGLAPYEGREALHHLLGAREAARWLARPRRERLRDAARCLCEAGTADERPSVFAG